MSRYAVHVDRFTSLDDPSVKERGGDPEAVLAVLRKVRRFSVWDMDNRTLGSTVTGLLRSGRIKQDETLGFPWVHVTFPKD